MESEKVKEIKKALELQRDGLMYLENNCAEIIYCKDILTLINELESENERLLGVAKEKIHDIGEMGYSNAIKIKQLQNRIAELEKENKDYYDRLNNLQTYIDNHEEIWKGNTNIALKQFAERLKEKAVSFEGERTAIVSFNSIDETLKEFINTNKGDEER